MKPVLRRIGRLLRQLKGDTTQHGELEVVLRALPPSFNPFVVEVGALDGKRISNSYPFIRRGWRALLIEPVPSNFRKLSLRYKNNPSVACRRVACSNYRGVATLRLGKAPGHATLSTAETKWFHRALSG